jgi:hypothetical protein
MTNTGVNSWKIGRECTFEIGEFAGALFYKERSSGTECDSG